MEKNDFGNLYQPQLERPGANFIKLFIRNLQFSQQARVFCPWQSFPAYINKHTSLV